MLFFRVVIPCGIIGRYQRLGETTSIFRALVGDSVFLRNIYFYLQVHTALQPRRQLLTYMHKIRAR
jgi:hypothetical protein